ncbi:unnamed protein product [Rhizophagus irregularis]|nr:unnamed protein product [Rhizophagus irregularis]
MRIFITIRKTVPIAFSMPNFAYPQWSDYIQHIWGTMNLDFLHFQVFPLDFIRSGFLWIFIRLGEDDGWMMDSGWWMVYINDR